MRWVERDEVDRLRKTTGTIIGLPKTTAHGIEKFRVLWEGAEWCAQHKSTGRFHQFTTTSNWWFEKDEDALLFVLRWGK